MKDTMISSTNYCQYTFTEGFLKEIRVDECSQAANTTFFLRLYSYIAVLNTLSQGTDVVGIVRYHIASCERRGSLSGCLLLENQSVSKQYLNFPQAGGAPDCLKPMQPSLIS